MGLSAKFNLAILAVFLVGFIGTGIFLRTLFVEDARQQVLQNAAIMMTAANAIRDYTTHEIAPIIGIESKGKFLAASVPSFAAQTNFRQVQTSFPDFTYKEAALNPTNPIDRSTDWEADFINSFRQHSGETELIGERETPTGRSLSLARPITIEDPACLSCHSTPDKAPAVMVQVYGTANGFGWQLHETIGAQIVSVPMALPLAKAERTFVAFMAILFAVFLAIMVILNLLLRFVIIRPVVKVSEVANAVSLGNLEAPEYERPGKDEIATLSQSFNRMRRSLESALKLLEEPPVT